MVVVHFVETGSGRVTVVAQVDEDVEVVGVDEVEVDSMYAAAEEMARRKQSSMVIGVMMGEVG